MSFPDVQSERMEPRRSPRARGTVADVGDAGLNDCTGWMSSIFAKMEDLRRSRFALHVELVYMLFKVKR